MENVRAIVWKNNELVLIDCTMLPLKEEYIGCKKYSDLIDAINSLAVRGAPAIGIAAAYGLVLAAIEADQATDSKEEYLDFIRKAAKELASTRPTAVNLFWALDRMMGVFENSVRSTKMEIRERLLEEANLMLDEDIKCNRKIGEYGNEIVPMGANILTHCNAGALATAGYGTALGVIRAAHKANKGIRVFADETRPLLQGARLTAWELTREGIPCTLITDNMAGYIMKLGRVDLVITGADRIALNGDSANKIGTYSLAVLAKEHGIPFYIAAPMSTIDKTINHGDDIIIEERNPKEVRFLYGVQTAPDSVNVFNPAFDVTPNKYIHGIITEKGILKPPYEVSIGNLIK
ncbi:MAG: S-methyl-5-thioribose-1-phosphate isomerase [Clostridiaceae bacterium]